MRLYGNVTDKDYFDACKRSVSELELENHVTFAGATTEPWKVYSNADVMAFASISEAFPYVVVEAMLCGAAIVATDVGGVREALADCGVLVPAKSPRQMADAIAFLLDHPAERERLGQPGASTCAAKFYGRAFSRIPTDLRTTV